MSVPKVAVLRTEVNRKNLYAPPMPTTTKRNRKRNSKQSEARRQQSYALPNLINMAVPGNKSDRTIPEPCKSSSKIRRSVPDPTTSGSPCRPKSHNPRDQMSKGPGNPGTRFDSAKAEIIIPKYQQTEAPEERS
ncbi:Hypothetical predicted protein [Pelobates cultripes]|uniref:Uncharacterized protein n=1 Tax=Pelobates cultripes TaxID=61616 RepID=A0AAD1WUX2_PELCU|nr:Hypothetical predicted protein [Pelobates cultripes]